MLAPQRYRAAVSSKWNMNKPSLRRQRRYERYALALLLLYCGFRLLGSITSSASNRIQYNFPDKSYVQHERQQAVKKEFLHAWDGYRDHSWMADGLRPLSGARRTQFCSWSATLVDALDTLWIMGLHEEFDNAVNATMTIQFKDNAYACEVSLFESTIRYLGGLLGAYDLSQEPRLLTKLVEVGDMLHRAFDTNNGMPCSFCHLAQTTEAYIPSTSVSMADIGSLYLEFSRLSQVTGDPKYVASVNKVLDVFAQTQNESSIPGLWPEMVDATSITPDIPGEERHFARASHSYSLGALSDSSYEYLVKGHLMLGKTNPLYAQLWHDASDQIKDLMLFRSLIPDAQSGTPSTSIPPNPNNRPALFSGIISHTPGLDTVSLEPRTQHLGCFAGGLYALSSRLFDQPSDLLIGAQLTQGCVWAYTHSPTGIMPETFSLAPCEDLLDPITHLPAQCAWDREIFNATLLECIYYDHCNDPNSPPGYLSVGDPKYILRPEAIESVFIMWRITGDEYWRDVGWTMFQSIIHHTRTPFGHSALSSVMAQYETEEVVQGVWTKIMRAAQSDDMESFWFAETLKYFWLLFGEVGVVSLDEWVLNTEAHPFRLEEGSRGFG